MDFGLDEQQEAARKTAEAIFGARPEPPVGELDREAWQLLARGDLLGLGLESESGGAGCGVLEVCAAVIEQGRSCAAVPLAETALVGAPTIERFGEGAHNLLRRAASGGAVIVPVLGDEPSARAREDGPGWIVDGEVGAVSYAPVADVLVVPALRPDGTVSVFVIERAAAGVDVVAQVGTTGRSVGQVRLSGVTLDAGCLLGGADAHRFLTDRATVGVCADQLGVLEEALRMTAQYTGERSQFGRRIGEFQAVAMRAADAYADVATCRVTLWRAAWLLATGQPAAAALAVAKFWAAEAGYRVSTAAQHLHGGTGVATDYPLHRYLRRARHNELALGGAGAQLAALGRQLAEGRPDS
jgi:alkylation response protein AidB-like acyl-CoA dehydrogenase